MQNLNLVTEQGVVSHKDSTLPVLDRSLEQLQEDLDSLLDDELEESIVDLKERIDAAHTELLVRVAEFDKRMISGTRYQLSTIGWLQDHCRMSPTEASGRVKTAQTLIHMPTVTATGLQGNIPYRSMQLLSQARDKHPDEFPAQEAAFVDTAIYLTPTDLGREINDWSQQVDYDQALSDVQTRDMYRTLYLAPISGELTDVSGALTPEVAHTLITAIDSLCDPGNLDDDDRRTRPQRQHDALGEISQFFLDHNQTVETSSGEKPHITITVPYDILTGKNREHLPEIDNIPVDPETIRKLLCDAGVVRIVTDPESQPLDIGRRTRTIPPALRRALELRDGGCTWQGCNAPMSWCDAHHITHWADGGETSFNNLTLLCRKHHTATHKQISHERSPPYP